MDDQLTINDLPVECVDEILKRIINREDRLLAQFVCKFWCALIDQDSSSECYRVDPWRINPLRLGQSVTYVFSEIFTPFINSQRKKTSFHFKNIDFKGSELFWRRKGAGIISLSFGKLCSNIPLAEIIDHCLSLKTLSLNGIFQRDVLKASLKNCIAMGKKNFSVRFLYLTGWVWLQEVTYLAEIARLVDQVFLGVRKVFFRQNKIFTNEILNQVHMYSIVFENLKFVIMLTDEERTFVMYDPSAGDETVKVTYLKMRIEREMIDLLSKLVSYPSKYQCLDTLHLSLSGMNDINLDISQVFIDLYPSLKSINISLGHDDILFIPLEKPLSKNNIDDLSPRGGKIDQVPFAINDAFLRSFENLTIFECPRLIFSHFVMLLREFPSLRKLSFDEGVVDVNPKQTISSENLLALKMPLSFLSKTVAKYNFSNLTELQLRVEDRDVSILALFAHYELSSLNINKELKRMNSPKLKIFHIQMLIDFLRRKVNRNYFTRWILKILALFPELTKFQFLYDDSKANSEKLITDKMMKKIFGKFRRLREIRLGPDKHTFTLLSPSHFKHGSSNGGNSVLVL